MECTPQGTLSLTQQIQNLAAGNYFDKLVYSLCLVSEAESSISVYDLLKVNTLVARPIKFESVETTDVSDVDILGGYLYLTLPLLEQVQVYEL